MTPVVPPTPTPTFAPLEYGYVLGGQTKPFLDSVAPYTTFAHIESDVCPGVAPSNDCGPQMDSINGHGLRVFLSVNDILFRNNPDGTATLYPDYSARFSAFATASLLGLRISGVYSIYLVDAPTQRGVPFADLKKAADLVKSAFPSVLVSFAESHTALAGLQVPTTVDLFGFAVYGIGNPNFSAAFSGYYASVLSKRSAPQQRILLISDGWWAQSPHGDAGLTYTDMGFVAKNYGDFALAHSADVRAVAVFLWPNVFPPGTTRASIDLPQFVRDQQKAVGCLIAHKGC